MHPNSGFGRRDLLAELGQLREEMNRLFSGAMPVRQRETLAVNCYVAGDEVLVMSELPGVEADDLRVTVHEDSLTVICTRRPEPETPGTTYLRRERENGTFSRTLQLPFRVNPDAVEARLERGVLRVRLPRAESDKPRRITVTAA